MEVRISGLRQDIPPKRESIKYVILIDTNKPDHRLNLLHDNVKKQGAVYNTIALGA